MSELTVLPLSPEDMVEFFKDKERRYTIDYRGSLENLQSPKFLLTYIANLGIRCDMNECPDELMAEYMILKEQAPVRNLCIAHGNILSMGKHGEMWEDVDELFDVERTVAFIQNHPDLVLMQMAFLNSLPLFTLTRMDLEPDSGEGEPNIREHLPEGVVETDAAYEELGFTLLDLIMKEDFLLYYLHDNPPMEDQIYFTRYFEEYMFGGRNLFYYLYKETNGYMSLVRLATLAAKGDEEAQKSLDKVTELVDKMLEDVAA